MMRRMRSCGIWLMSRGIETFERVVISAKTRLISRCDVDLAFHLVKQKQVRSLPRSLSF